MLTCYTITFDVYIYYVYKYCIYLIYTILSYTDVVLSSYNWWVFGPTLSSGTYFFKYDYSFSGWSGDSEYLTTSIKEGITPGLFKYQITYSLPFLLSELYVAEETSLVSDICQFSVYLCIIGPLNMTQERC